MSLCAITITAKEFAGSCVTPKLQTKEEKMRRALAVLGGLVFSGLVVQSGLVLTQQPQPPLNIDGIKIIQAIPVGGEEILIKKPL